MEFGPGKAYTRWVNRVLQAIRGRPVLVGMLALGLAWRLFLAWRFYGWEEDDYGNLARSFAVAHGGLSELAVSHLPLYYLVNAGLIRIFGHAEVVCVGTSMVCGLIAMGLAMDLARRVAGARAELLTGLVLLIQGEFALYAATSLREPMYTALGLAGVWLLVRGRTVWAGVFMACTMLVRADAMLTFWAGYLLLTVPRKRATIKPFLAGAACLIAVLVGWSVWSKPETGSWLFFAPQLYANLDFGGLEEGLSWSVFLRQGVEVCVGLVTHVLPRKVGWPLLLAALWAVTLVARRRLWDRAAVAVALFFALHMGFWLGTGLCFQHGIEHNLYWKWLYVSVPFLTLTAVFGLDDLVERLDDRRAGLGKILLAAALAWFVVCAALETRFQIRRADDLYYPQVELARWIEAEIPPGEALIVDNVPRSYLNRRHHGYVLLSWFDIEDEIKPGSRFQFDALLGKEEVVYALWFREGWTRAPTVAPFLSVPEPVELYYYRLEPERWDDAYGWIWWQVLPVEDLQE